MDMGILLILMVVLAVFAVSAAELGVDSRDEVSDDPHRSSYPIGLG
jgi:hypothetical protein